MDIENKSNILFTPDFSKIKPQETMPIEISDNNNNTKSINQSSMITYAKIVCCICGASIEANAKGICSTCDKKSIDITSGITKQGIIHYCKGCDRYLRPPWIKCAAESQDMMSLCISKIKGLNKIKVIDSSFIWTEEHSKIIKIKITIQKEINKSNVTASFLAEFKVEWIQCDDCKKTFTPHIWSASVQVRQKVKHKRTFLLLEQLILMHKAHTKAINIKEHPEGVDFYFSNKSQANTFVSFVSSVFPIKRKQSRQLISHDQKSNTFNFKYTFMSEIAPICKYDLIVLDHETYKKLGGIGPVVLCFKQTWKIHLVDPVTFETLDVDSNTYWRYEFKTYVDRDYLTEFLILSCEEEVDYNKKYQKERELKGSNMQMEVDSGEKNSTRLNTTVNQSKYDIQYDKNIEKNRFKIVNVKCMRNNSKDNEIIEVRTFLGEKMHPGNIYYGYDMKQINFSQEFEGNMSQKMNKVPEVILVKKKYKTYIKAFKLRRMKIDDEDDGNNNKGKKKKKEIDKDFEEFKHDVAVSKELRDQIKVYKDDEAIEKLAGDFTNLVVAEDEKGDSDVDFKVEELLDNLKIEEEEEEKDDNDNDNDDSGEENDFNEDDDDMKKKNIIKDKQKKQIGKRERTGDKLDDSDSDEK